MSGVVFFSKSPFKQPDPTQSEIVVPYELPTVDGGAPDTDHEGGVTLDCGSPTTTTTVRNIDGRIDGAI